MTHNLRAAHLNAQALSLRRQGLSYKEVARVMGGLSQQRARLRALAGLRDEAILREGKHYYHLKRDTYLNCFK